MIQVKPWVIAGLCLFLGTGFTCVSSSPVNQNSQPVLSASQTINSQVETEPVEEPIVELFSTTQLGEIDSHLSFSATIPSTWEAEYIPDIQAINFFDSSVEGKSNLEKSQLFVRYFVANQFLTLQTVTIYSENESVINDRPAVTYEIEKKSNVADFAFQPSWRNQRHFVTDIRSTDDNPTTFYVFAQRPGLDQEVIEAFLQSVTFN